MINGESASRGVMVRRIKLKLWITTKHRKNEMKQLDPIHPGEILLEDFMKPMDISINQLARDLHVPPNRVSAIVNGKRSITADTALRLSAHFGVSPETWLGLQIDYDLRLARKQDGAQIPRNVRTRQAA